MQFDKLVDTLEHTRYFYRVKIWNVPSSSISLLK
jgi:hypothetical protein